MMNPPLLLDQPTLAERITALRGVFNTVVIELGGLAQTVATAQRDQSDRGELPARLRAWAATTREPERQLIQDWLAVIDNGNDDL